MFAALLNKVFKKGTLTVIWPDGSAGTYGSGLPKAAIRVHGRGTLLAIALRPDLAFGEAYMDGRVTVEEGSIADVLELALSNVPPGSERWITKARARLRTWARPIAQFNPMRRSRRNVAHHYDLSGALFDLFLDADRQYSCAYFQHPKVTLEAAQAAKKRHIAAKLKLDRPELKEWRSRFRKNRAKAAALYDERFCRMWELYLASAEMSFRNGRNVVFQFQSAKRPDALPLTRDYMLESERTARFGTVARADEAA